jgi:hypothetical protein
VLWSPVSWPLRQPSAHSVKFVGGVAVDNQINLEERSVGGESLDLPFALPPQPLLQSILLGQLVRTSCATVEPREHVTHTDGMLFLRRLYTNRQLCCRPKCHFRKCTTSESGHGFDGSFVETLGGNPNGVLDAFGIGE